METPIIAPIEGYSATEDKTARTLEAVRAYIAAFSTPPLDKSRIYPGDSDVMVLPAGSNDYAVFYVLDQQAVGTPLEQPGEGNETRIGTYVRTRVQIDIYSDAGRGYDNARTRAQTLSTLARTPTGVGFFDQFDIDCLFCDYASSAPVVTDSKRKASRWTLTLNLGFWQWITVKQDYFTGIADNVQNVDVAFHP